MNRERASAVGGYQRNAISSARMAAMKVRYNIPGLGGSKGGDDSSYDMTTFDNLLAAIKKWNDGLANLSDPASLRKKLAEEDAGDERVHKLPATGRQSVKDVVMGDAPPPALEVVDIKLNNRTEVDRDCSSSASLARIRPSTPPNLFRNENLIHEGDHEMHAPADAPNPPEPDPAPHSSPIFTSGPIPPPVSMSPTNLTSPTAKKLEDLDIHTPQGNSSPALATTSIPTIPQQHQQHSPPQISSPRPQRPTPIIDGEREKSTMSPFTLPVFFEDKQLAKAEFAEIKASNATTPLPSEIKITTTMHLKKSSSSIHSSSESTKKKQKLSSGVGKTLLDTLMEKKAKNPVYYDGPAQKMFHEFVLEMSQQIQSVKKERRMVMFAKDPACSNLLEKIDKILQECLKIVENTSFKWLKGRPDLKEMKDMQSKFNDVKQSSEEFKKSGWTPGNDDGSSEEDDDDEDDDDESTEADL